MRSLWKVVGGGSYTIGLAWRMTFRQVIWMTLGIHYVRDPFVYLHALLTWSLIVRHLSKIRPWYWSGVLVGFFKSYSIRELIIIGRNWNIARAMHLRLSMKTSQNLKAETVLSPHPPPVTATIKSTLPNLIRRISIYFMPMIFRKLRLARKTVEIASQSMLMTT